MNTIDFKQKNQDSDKQKEYLSPEWIKITYLPK